ncbi:MULTISPECIES: Crp/Fnr family transcriptional regulator [unclassified Bradyrhizobium]|jgi:CRP-like cAMP-binding protein|uniref:Crp/Fnr family transcriptional regulator n=2 Tax=Pseudomonadota TaxID=1224 RepID=UPI0004648FF4|nr:MULTISPECIES: Crp/Fnr family transcriptional regulator [unclassified Bradyrhizobium]AUC98364.1 Crp/Fnr family transcriptional regulator [Bradyrhizobium sp. SK17]
MSRFIAGAQPEEGGTRSGDRQILAQTNGQPSTRNVLLAGLAVAERAAIGPLLEPCRLKARTILQEPRRRVDHVYFLESGIVSLRIVAPEGLLETAITGYRGAVGIPFLLGGSIPTQQSIVLFSGNSLRIRSDDLRRVMREYPDVLERLLRYAQALNVHSTQAALCGARHELMPRLACWLCLAADAIDGDVLPVTHDYLSMALAMRRAGVTEALLRFEELGLIRKMRGVLQINDHRGLQQKACGCYSVISGAYAQAENAAGYRLDDFLGRPLSRA